MRIILFFTVITALQLAAGHTLFTKLFVDDVDQGDGTCVRMPMTPSNATFPVEDLSSDNMACGYGGTTRVARVCPVNQGSKLTFLFREYPDGSQNGSIDSSHKGPCAVYMKPVTSAISSTATGQGWSKIWDEGYDATNLQWCTEKLIQNNGLLSVKIPEEFAGGHYLVRTELLALHDADKTPLDPQFYVGCAQIWLNSTATGVPTSRVDIPGYVNITDPAVLFNIYTPKWPYTTPGPAPLTANDFTTYPNKTSSEAQNEGLLPLNVVLTNANWWGVELDSYTDENGCWAASAKCFDQESACYNTAPPTGSANCVIWNAKCMEIQNNCDAGNWRGPPNKGDTLKPAPSVAYSNLPPPASQAVATDLRRMLGNGNYWNTTSTSFSPTPAKTSFINSSKNLPSWNTTALSARTSSVSVEYTTVSGNFTVILATTSITSTITVKPASPNSATTSSMDQPAYPTSSTVSLSSLDVTSESAIGLSTTASTPTVKYLMASSSVMDVQPESDNSFGTSTSDAGQAAAATSTVPPAYPTSSVNFVPATGNSSLVSTTTFITEDIPISSATLDFPPESTDSVQAGPNLAAAISSTVLLAYPTSYISSSEPVTTRSRSDSVSTTYAPLPTTFTTEGGGISATPTSDLTVVTTIGGQVFSSFNFVAGEASTTLARTLTSTPSPSSPAEADANLLYPTLSTISYEPGNSGTMAAASSTAAPLSSTPSSSLTTQTFSPSTDGLCGGTKTCLDTTSGICC